MIKFVCEKCGKEREARVPQTICRYCKMADKLKGRQRPESVKSKVSASLKGMSTEKRDELNKRKVSTQRKNHNGNYHSNTSKIGQWAKTEEGKKRISKIKKTESFNRRNSDWRIEYEKEVIKKRGYKVLSVEKDINNETFFNIKCKCGNEFQWHMIGDVCRPYCEKCFNKPFSNQEKDLAGFLGQYVEIIENDRRILEGSELDIFIPSKNLAIEYDGLYWHNDKNNTWKFEKCREKGIRLIRISEPEWIEKRDLIQDYLLATLNIFKRRIFARKCEVRKIKTDEYRAFCEENHLQGYSQASVKLGLFYENELVEIASFGKPRFEKKHDFELIRECSKRQVNIIGGKAKLLKYFIRNYEFKSLLSYCEKDKFSGISYFKFGFTLENESPSGYLYYKGSYKPHSRMEFLKKNLPTKLSKFDSRLTEWENMQLNGWMRLFDFGQFVFSYNKE